MKFPLLALALIGLAALAMTWAPRSTATAPIEHQRLQPRNTFKSPADVVRYYCARDASGFVWSGLLDVERRAFTLWKSLPQQDSFLVAETYEVHPGKPPTGTTSQLNEAYVEVRYHIKGMSDAFGTFTASENRDHRVLFQLKKDAAGAWKINQPDASMITPIVLLSKFPVAAAK